MKLGKLQEIDIREVWTHEQYDFSKWLSAEDNIQELGNVLNLSHHSFLIQSAFVTRIL